MTQYKEVTQRRGALRLSFHLGEWTYARGSPPSGLPFVESLHRLSRYAPATRRCEATRKSSIILGLCFSASTIFLWLYEVCIFFSVGSSLLQYLSPRAGCGVEYGRRGQEERWRPRREGGDIGGHSCVRL